ncbi:hypothetical protein GGR55DRAFT_637301 [Xylaria sp. FL0064]|nr:hypothetical protein GGR55DRAFT_637301 [Xylaria sp. FL0064]
MLFWIVSLAVDTSGSLHFFYTGLTISRTGCLMKASRLAGIDLMRRPTGFMGSMILHQNQIYLPKERYNYYTMPGSRHI